MVFKEKVLHSWVSEALIVSRMFEVLTQGLPYQQLETRPCWRQHLFPSDKSNKNDKHCPMKSLGPSSSNHLAISTGNWKWHRSVSSSLHPLKACKQITSSQRT